MPRVRARAEHRLAETVDGGGKPVMCTDMVFRCRDETRDGFDIAGPGGPDGQRRHDAGRNDAGLTVRSA